MTEAAKTRRGPGRPTRLTPAVADAIVARVAGGDDLATAATAVGVGLRTLRRWRSSAYSRDPRDVNAVALERRIVWALGARSRASTPEKSWEELAARLENEHPERWAALPELDEVLEDFGEVA